MTERDFFMPELIKGLKENRVGIDKFSVFIFCQTLSCLLDDGFSEIQMAKEKNQIVIRS